MLVPKLVTTLRTYNREQFTADLSAGIVVGVVALPLAIAFAIASGVTPDRGLYTAIIAGFLISALGGSRVQVGGPTGAFVVIVFGIVQKYGIDGLMVATMMGGVILVGFGLARLGGAIKFIPYPVITGFTSGIALIIFSTQVKDLLGLQVEAVPSEFIPKWGVYLRRLGTADPTTVLVGGVTLAIIIVWSRLRTRLPGPFVALVGTTVVVQLMHLRVDTIGSRFGIIDASFPRPMLPHVDFAMVTAMVGPAFTIALLAGIESLLSAVVADGMIGGRHRTNMELVAQGIANIASPLFGGIPATGAIARTATNVKNGGRTPVAGIVHALTLLLITLYFGKWAALIPMATLAGILVVVAYHMSEWRTFRAEFRAPKSDLFVLLITFSLTVLVDLTVAVEVGIVLAAFLFMRRMSEVTNITALTRELGEDAVDPAIEGLRVGVLPKGVEVYEINGPFFFGAAEKFKETILQLRGTPRVLVIVMRRVPAMDSTGIAALRDVVGRFRRSGTRVILAGVHAQPMAALQRSAFAEEIPGEDLVGTLDEAVALARTHLEATG
ncbi:MAG: SulP family inorganic anion transporter [Gemmatimonadales bacterium]